MNEIRNAFKRTFRQADVSILDRVTNPLNGNIFFMETGMLLNRGKGGEQGTLVRLDSEQFEVYLEEKEENQEEEEEEEEKDVEPACYTGWYDVPVYEVSTSVNNSEDTVTLLPGSINNISYELYPMDQGETFGIENLGFAPDNLILESELCDSDSVVCEEDISLENSVKYTIGDINLFIGHYGDYKSYGGIVYVLTKESKLLSGFKDNKYNFQMGDGETNVYSYEDKIVVHNMGDVSSIVIINLKQHLK